MISKYDVLLIQMAYLNQLYKTDALSLVDDGNNNNSKIVNTMLARGWLNEREIAQVGATKAKAKVVAITYEGRRYLAKKFEDSYYTETAREIQRPWNTNDPKLLHRRLSENRVKTMMLNAGALVIPEDKPALGVLYAEAYDREPIDVPDYYNNEMTLEETLEAGVYYANDELRDFLETINGEVAYDIMNGSRFKGIYMNKNIIALCYISNVTKNRKIRITPTVEQRAVRILTNILTSINGAYEMEAIVISSGDALVEMMCPKHKEDKPTQQVLLDWETSVFHKLHVFPKTKLGIDSLNYMLTHSKQEWTQDSYNLYDSLDFTESIRENISNDLLIGRNKYTKNRIIFIPYFNLNVLKFISQFHEPIEIMTIPEMAQTIANIIRRQTGYHDMQGNPILVSTPRQASTEKKRISHMVSVPISFSRDDKNKIKQIAKINGQTVSSYVRSKIKETLEQDFLQAQQKLQEEKLIRRKIRKE